MPDYILSIIPFLIPLIILEWILIIAALIHIFRHPHYKFGNKVIWVLVVVFVQIIGPVVYFIFGRGDE